jgi:hypothetical protein
MVLFHHVDGIENIPFSELTIPIKIADQVTKQRFQMIYLLLLPLNHDAITPSDDLGIELTFDQTQKRPTLSKKQSLIHAPYVDFFLFYQSLFSYPPRANGLQSGSG